MQNCEIYLMAGFFGGVIRGLSGFLKQRKQGGTPKFNYSYFFSTVFISGIIGCAAGLVAEGNWKTAFLAGYAGLDFIENVYKSSPLSGLGK